MKNKEILINEIKNHVNIILRGDRASSILLNEDAEGNYYLTAYISDCYRFSIFQFILADDSHGIIIDEKLEIKFPLDLSIEEVALLVFENIENLGLGVF